MSLLNALHEYVILQMNMDILYAEAALQSCYYKKVFWKYTANLQDAEKNIKAAKQQNIL